MEHGGLTIQALEALCPGVNRRTLQRDLKAMVEKGLFVEPGTGPSDPTRHYRLKWKGVESAADGDFFGRLLGATWARACA